MLLEKKALSLEEIEAQTALELPDRELLDVNFTLSQGLSQGTSSGNGSVNVLSGLNVAALDNIGVQAGCIIATCS